MAMYDNADLPLYWLFPQLAPEKATGLNYPYL